MKLLFDLELARRQEAERRLMLLGDYASQEYDPKQLRTFAADRYIPRYFLIQWKLHYKQNGTDGLLPQDWTSLPKKTQNIVRERFRLLGKLVDATTITPANISSLASKLDGSTRQAERLIRRYQIGGVWGLVPERHPEKPKRAKGRETTPDVAGVDDELLKVAEKRLELIKPFLNRRRVPNEDLRAYGKEKGVSLRVLRKYLHDYRIKGGLKGLIPKGERSDKGHFHDISERMTNVVMGIRLSHKDISLHHVHTLACQRAELLAEPMPSKWQVRQICSSIPEEVIKVADGRYNEYRNRFRTTYRYFFDGSIIIYQLDFTPVDVLVKDIRRRGAKSHSNEVRPKLTICLESSSRLIVGYLFTYDDPSSDEVACALHDALLVTQQKPFGGIPHAIWVDKGKQFISDHMYQVARDFAFELHECTPSHEDERGAPQKKGRVERFFETLNQKLWSTLPGYVASNTEDRNPHVKAELTLKELVDKFQKFLAEYHSSKHSETKQSPLQFWADHCFALPAAPRDLDILLLPLTTRVHKKEGIQYANGWYWSDKLAGEVPADAVVELRAAPAYIRPDTVEVFYQGQWILTATARDSDEGRSVTGKQVLTAQRRQSKRINTTIKNARDALKHADSEVETIQASNDQAVAKDEEAQNEQKPHNTNTKPKGTPARQKSVITQNSQKNAWDAITQARQQANQRSQRG